ncbi:hypothetical protein H0A36_06245 [Endozoicomonas sp. SM1973]|uniref:Uncharacterized protein n=1 Tax=Spartinivicinus marinus TaxID=2994442 RepID=A0A853IDU0_9GAMM|nr:hypothetical protein [Spartinivicinus marinus]MCX4028271.1 hypothetical protein [Spartinivicinus marinus]NYZ65606.1 hypothetical protein [Spartinivicinus marinus]
MFKKRILIITCLSALIGLAVVFLPVQLESDFDGVKQEPIAKLEHETVESKITEQKETNNVIEKKIDLKGMQAYVEELDSNGVKPNENIINRIEEITKQEKQYFDEQVAAVDLSLERYQMLETKLADMQLNMENYSQETFDVVNQELQQLTEQLLQEQQMMLEAYKIYNKRYEVVSQEVLENYMAYSIED